MFKIANSGTVRVPAEILTRTERETVEHHQ